MEEEAAGLGDFAQWFLVLLFKANLLEQDYLSCTKLGFSSNVREVAQENAGEGIY